jgi:hypothetical protein
LERVKNDLERIVAKGIEGILFCDSNFGALPDDSQKAEWLIQLKTRFGRPMHFATCWSKNHNSRVQGIVRLLHRHHLLEHYTMAVQTLTPLALRLANRVNMPDYEVVAKAMVRDGVPIVSELIWGLPGETLMDFERNLDKLTKIFPSHTIYPYAMLPDTDLFRRREDYRIETMELAPYGEATAEYIVSCHTFTRQEGLQGYYLITAWILLYRGNIIPLTIRYLALSEVVSVSRVLRAVLANILERFYESFPAVEGTNAAVLFERRQFVYRWLLNNRIVAFKAIRNAVVGELETVGCLSSVRPLMKRLLLLDELLCPRKNNPEVFHTELNFAADRVIEFLERMELPEEDVFASTEMRDVVVVHGRDFGDDAVPNYHSVPKQALRGRYPVWP